MGRYSCDELCERLFDCGIHKCEKPCHPPLFKPPLCPCPLQNHPLSIWEEHHRAKFLCDQSSYTFSSRANCTSPIPTCDSFCSKPTAYSRPCMTKCHVGPYPPCSVKILRPCRCGSTTRNLAYYEAHKPSHSTTSKTEENETCAIDDALLSVLVDGISVDVFVVL